VELIDLLRLPGFILREGEEPRLSWREVGAVRFVNLTVEKVAQRLAPDWCALGAIHIAAEIDAVASARGGADGRNTKIPAGDGHVVGIRQYEHRAEAKDAALHVLGVAIHRLAAEKPQPRLHQNRINALLFGGLDAGRHAIRPIEFTAHASVAAQLLPSRPLLGR